MVYLAKQGSFALGTKRHRLPNCQLPVELSQLMGSAYLHWLRKTTFASKNPVSKVDFPYIITEYNHHMEGVNLLNSLISTYKIHLENRKWYLRVFYHLIDITIENVKNQNQAEFRFEVASVSYQTWPSNLESEFTEK